MNVNTGTPMIKLWQCLQKQPAEHTSYSAASPCIFYCLISKTHNIILINKNNIILINKKISLNFDSRWVPQLHDEMLYFWP